MNPNELSFDRDDEAEDRVRIPDEAYFENLSGIPLSMPGSRPLPRPRARPLPIPRPRTGARPMSSAADQMAEQMAESHVIQESILEYERAQQLECELAYELIQQQEFERELQRAIEDTRVQDEMRATRAGKFAHTKRALDRLNVLDPMEPMYALVLNYILFYEESMLSEISVAPDIFDRITRIMRQIRIPEEEKATMFRLVRRG